MKVAILSINIGNYIDFWKLFYESCERNFIGEAKKEYYVFTDWNHIEYETNENVHLIPQSDLGWPGNTLMRYEMFLRIEKYLKAFDYIFFGNANLLFVEPIGAEILPDEEERLVFVRAHGSYLRKNFSFPYESNPQSTAYVDATISSVYVRGGLNGGIAEAYLEMCQELAKNIRIDMDNDIVAIWHDESHITNYAIKHPNSKMLPPSYLYPQEYVMPYPQHILIRQKNNEWVRYGKFGKINWFKNRLKIFIRNTVYRFLIRMKIIQFEQE